MKRTSYSAKTLPSVLEEIKHLGSYIRIARKRRQKTMAEVAERLNLGYQTVVRIEKGDPGVAMAAYMSVLWLLELDRQFTAAVHPDHDITGKALELSRLPERVMPKRGSKQSEHDF